MESLQESDVCRVFALVESLVDATIVELAQIYCQVQRNVRESLLPGLTHAIALLASITAPGDLESLRAVSCFCFCCGVYLIQRPVFQWDIGVPLGYGAADNEGQ